MQKALLIQDLSDFRAVIEPLLARCLAPYLDDRWVNLETALKWVICEEIMDTYCLWDLNHHKLHPYPQIHDRLKNTFHEVYPGWDFSWFFSRMIKVPQVYNDTAQIEVVLRGRDLFIHYRSVVVLSLPFSY